ncbi:MAG: HD domain-containing protein [Bacilli bacterium]|nr:HD domain-containing protein [Bacilli bacterium]
MKINDELKKYIEENILPEYNKNERAHGIEHIKYVIDRSFDLIAQNNLNLNNDMVYTIAAFHDIGHHIDSKTHEIISAEIMIQDKNLHQFFSDKELITIKEAIEDHRASKKSEPRSIYGKLVSSADRNDSVEQCLRRTYTYGKKIDPKADDETLFLRAFDVLTQKFGVGGYAKFYFKDDLYEQFLQELRKLLQDKKNFCETQRKYIEKLKNQGEL